MEEFKTNKEINLKGKVQRTIQYQTFPKFILGYMVCQKKTSSCF